MKNKIGVMYICTGNYSIFWKQFFLSCEKYFLPNQEIQYFVFTDSKKIYGDNFPHVNKIYQEKLQFPRDTLLRFDMFLRAKEALKKMDYLFFFNANLLFLQTIFDEEVFPSSQQNGLIGYLHFAMYDKNPNEFIYERNPISTAYIKPGDGQHYYQGCVIGGKSKEFLEMANVLDAQIKEDLVNDFIAVWWDESHLNHYLLNKEVKILHPGYCFPELGFDDLPFEKKAISRNKSVRGGVEFLRGRDRSFFSKLKFFIKRLYIKI